MEEYKRQINDVRYCPLLELLVCSESPSLRGLRPQPKVESPKGLPKIPSRVATMFGNGSGGLTQGGFHPDRNYQVKDFHPLPRVFAARERVGVTVTCPADRLLAGRPGAR
jgi:hypothetical protein